MRKRVFSSVILAALAALSATSEVAAAQPSKSVLTKSGVAHRHRYAGECARRRRASANRGALAGGAGGAIVGAAAMATPIGAGVGVLAGHEIGKRMRRC